MKKTPRLNFDRLLAGKSGKQLSVILIIFFVILLSVTGFYTYCSKVRDYTSFIEFVKDFPVNFPKAFVDLTNPETLHESVYDPNQNTEPTNKLPPEWLLFIAYIIGTIVFTGLLIATITNAWRGRAERFRRGAVSYKFKRHIVFLGYNHLIAGMILKILENEKDARIVVGVENNASVISDKIKNRLYDRHRKNVVVLQADSCNREDLKRLRVCRAKEVFVIGEHDDAYNLKCYRTIYELSLGETSKKAEMPQCYVNLESQATLTLFRTYASSGELGIDFNKFQSFSFYDEWARMMLMKILKKGWAFNENNQDHFIIAGMTEMGIALATKVILLDHNPIIGKPIKITFIDEEVVSKSVNFIIQHQKFFDYCQYRIKTKNYKRQHYPNSDKAQLDFEFEFVEGKLSDENVRHIISQTVGFLQQSTTIALCYDNPQQNITMGLNLPNIVYEDFSKTRIWVYQPTFGNMGYYLRSSRYKNVITFGMLGEDLDIRNTKNIDKAKLINHYFRHQNDTNIKYSDTDIIKIEWKQIDISKRWSYIRCAEFIPFLSKYKNDESKMSIMEHKRNAVDVLLFPSYDDDNSYSPQNNYSNYFDTLKLNIAKSDFTINNKKYEKRKKDNNH